MTHHIVAPSDLRGRRVTIMGLGRFGGGGGVTRWLAAQGARLTVTDKAEEESLRTSLESIAGLDVRTVLGRHDERDFTDADLVVANPAVPESSPYLEAARAAGVPITTEINLFVQRCPARTIGITGSVGKSTVTAMTAHILSRVGAARVFAGGNLGGSLLDSLPEMTPRDWAVLELSSFQLTRTPTIAWSPNVALITNLAPNHLDWHGSFEAYASAKFQLFRFQSAERGDQCALPDDPAALSTTASPWSDVPPAAWRFGLNSASEPFARPPVDAAHQLPTTFPGFDLPVPGRHNRLNAAAALAAAMLAGAPADSAAAALADFRSLPHRLQWVARRHGVEFINDSKSSSPAAAVTAIHAFDGSLLMIVGGYDKHVDLAPVFHAARGRVRYAACIGQTAEQFRAGMREANVEAEVWRNLEEAVRACVQRASPGDTVLLSPASASWDMFTDFQARGDEFTRLVRDQP